MFSLFPIYITNSYTQEILIFNIVFGHDISKLHKLKYLIQTRLRFNTSWRFTSSAIQN